MHNHHLCLHTSRLQVYLPLLLLGQHQRRDVVGLGSKFLSINRQNQCVCVLTGSTKDPADGTGIYYTVPPKVSWSGAT
jgi:hypothetical protein